MEGEMITFEWLKENGWRFCDNTFNKTVNGITYYLEYDQWVVLSFDKFKKQELLSGTVVGSGSYVLSKQVAVVSTVQGVDMLTSTGKEFDENTVVSVNDGDECISRSWARDNGWHDTFTGNSQKFINGAWYELEYTDFDCDYILKKEIAKVKCIDELEVFLK
jgi:hypothetical protein